MSGKQKPDQPEDNLGKRVLRTRRKSSYTEYFSQQRKVPNLEELKEDFEEIVVTEEKEVDIVSADTETCSDLSKPSENLYPIPPQRQNSPSEEGIPSQINESQNLIQIATDVISNSEITVEEINISDEIEDQAIALPLIQHQNTDLNQSFDIENASKKPKEINQKIEQNNCNKVVLWTPKFSFTPQEFSTCLAKITSPKRSEAIIPKKLRFEDFQLNLSQEIFNDKSSLLDNPSLRQPIRLSITNNTVYHSILSNTSINFTENNDHSREKSIFDSNQIEISFEEINPNPIKRQAQNMAFTANQYVDLIPKCKDEKSVEQFISIVDTLHAGVENNDALKAVFLAIVKSKILGKAFNAIKGKSQDSWENIKNHLVAGLEDKIDSPTASNKLVQIRQKKEESLKDYITRIKDALADLDKISIRNNNNEVIKNHVLGLNDATAKSTFEFGLWNKQLKTIVVAAQKSTFAESQSFAVNQESTNFPELKTESENKQKSPNKNPIICYYCNKKGHIAPECRSKKRDGNRRNFNSNGEVNSPNNFSQPKSRQRESSNEQLQWNDSSNTQPNRSIPGDNSRPQWNRWQPNNYNRTQSNDTTRPQYNNYKYNNSRSSDNSNRNKNDNKSNVKSDDRNIRRMREIESDWEPITTIGMDVCDQGN